MEKAKVTRENINKHLIEYQLQMVGKSLIDTLDDDRWWFNITMTSEQKIAFNKYAFKLIKKTFKCNTQKATNTLKWFNEEFGLRIKEK